MKRYTIHDICTELAIPRSTLLRRMRRLGITASPDTLDHRLRIISESDMQRLRSATESLQNQVKTATESRSQLLQKIANLEQRIAELEHHHVPEAVKRDSDGLPLAVDRLSSFSHRDDVPTGWISLEGFAKSEQIPPSTLRHAITIGTLPAPHMGVWRQGRATIRYALDPDMQAIYRQRYKR